MMQEQLGYLEKAKPLPFTRRRDISNQQNKTFLSLARNDRELKRKRRKKDIC